MTAFSGNPIDAGIEPKVGFGSNPAVRTPSREPPESAQKRRPSDHDPLNLIEADLIAPAIVVLRRAR
jgi:hypothetical protein